MPSSASTPSHLRASSVELLEGLAAEDAATLVAQAKRDKHLRMKRARSKRYYERKKLERIMV